MINIAQVNDKIKLVKFNNIKLCMIFDICSGKDNRFLVNFFDESLGLLFNKTYNLLSDDPFDQFLKVDPIISNIIGEFCKLYGKYMVFL